MLDRFFTSRKFVTDQQKAIEIADHKYSDSISRSIKKGYRQNMSSGRVGVSMRHINRDGAKYYGTLVNYNTSPISSQSSYFQREIISNRSWDLYVNDAATNGLIETLCVDVASTGLTPIATPMTEYLGLNSDWEDEYQQNCRDYWEIWGLSPSKSCDVTRRMTINQMMLWSVFSWKLEGIALWIPLMLPESPLRPFSLSLQAVAPYRLKTPYDLLSRGDIYDGIEVDENGTPIAYWIKKSTGSDDYTYVFDSKENFIRIPAYNQTTGRPNIIACYSTRNICEYRSESILTAILKTLRDRHDHKDAALVGSVVANLFTVFLKNGLVVRDKNNETIREPMQEINGGTILSGAAGEEPTVIKTDRPGPHFKDMDYSTVEELGMASGRGFEKILHKWDSSFSASRMSSLQALKFDNVDRDVLISGFCDPVRTMLLEEAMLKKMIKVIDVEHFYKHLYAYTKVNWLPPQQGDVDPVKTETAYQLAMQTGSKNFSDICAEHGKWWKDSLTQRAKELKFKDELEKKYGISLTGQILTGMISAQNSQNNKNDNTTNGD